MGELILCPLGIAAMPYYIESISLNIYSMEELCYYIQKYADRIDENFWTEELCAWIDEELQCNETAELLRQKIKETAGVADLVHIIADSCGYFSKEEKQGIEQQLRGLENKSEYEKSKLRADRYLMNRYYVSSIEEYQKLLKMTENEPRQVLETGSIWHNMGVANAQMFLYEQAAECFKKAYEYNNLPESLIEMYVAQQCISNKKQVEGQELPDEWRECVMARLQEAANGRKEALEEDEKGNLERILAWKNEYRLYSKL